MYRTLRPLLVALALLPTPAFAQVFQGLGHLPGDAYSRARGVSGDGRVVVGESALDTNVERKAFVWTVTTGLREIPLSDCESCSRGVAHGVSADGTTIVGVRGGVDPPAFRKVGEGAPQGLPYLFENTNEPDNNYNAAYALSPDGGAVVGISMNESFVSEAVVWYGDDVLGLGALPGGIISEAWGASAGGAVVVGTAYTATAPRAFRWTTSGGMADLGTLDGSGWSQAWGVSADGSVVVGTSTDAGGFSTAFRWTEAEGMEGLVNIPGGVNSRAYAVSLDGSVIVGSVEAPAGQGGAAIWTEAEGVRLLADILEQDHGVVLGGWFLGGAHAVSADGSVIVGTGRNPLGQPEAYRVVLCGAVAEWNHDGGGAFSDPENWLDLVVPDSTSTARFDYGDAYTVTFSEDVDNNRLELSDGVDAAFGLGSNTHTLSGACADETVEVDGARLSVRAGTLRSEKAVVLTGTQAEPGELLVRDSGARLEVDSAFVSVGREGAGLLRVEGPGAEAATFGVFIGEGAGGDGALEVVGGGRLLVDFALLMATDEGSVGDLLVSGPESELALNLAGGVGGEGTATARVASGARLFFEAADGAQLTLGSEAAGSGTLLVESEGGVEGDELVVGLRGVGEVGVSGDGTLRVDRLVLAKEAGSDGSVTASDLGPLTVRDLAEIGVRGEGTLFVIQGLLSQGDGLAFFTLGVEPEGRGDVQFGLGSLGHVFGMTVGQRGAGVLNVQDAGTWLTVDALFVGGAQAGDGGTGAATVTTGATLRSDHLNVGRGGAGTLSVSDGGTVSAGTLYLYGGTLPQNDGGTITAGQIVVEPAPAPRAEPPSESMAESVVGPVTARARDGANDAAGGSPPLGTGVVRTDTLLVFGEGVGIVTDALTVLGGGVVGGTGFPFGFTSAGTLSPADTASATATFAVEGDLVQTAEGVLEVELGGTTEGRHDRLSVMGTATLGGTLRFVRRPDYVPEVGDQYEVVTAASVAGTFESVETPADVALAVSYTATGVVATVTGVTVDAEGGPDPAAVPYEAVLLAPYPNPVAGRATMSFEVPEAGPVRLVVYDVLGREVAVLAEGPVEAGRHEAVLDAVAMPSGTYVVRLTAGGSALVQRVTVVR